jgi:hypothetical protein
MDVTCADFTPQGLALHTQTVGAWSREVVQRVPHLVERALLVGIVIASIWSAWMLTTAQDAGAMARDTCVVTTMQDARAFAEVLGDDRPVDVSFAEQECDQH